MIQSARGKYVRGDGPSEMIAAARERLLQSAYPLLRNVSVELRHGTMVLRGTLPNYFHKQMAQETVAAVHGIGEIVNEIEVAMFRPH